MFEFSSVTIYVFQGHVFIAVGITIIAVLYQIECDSKRWRTNEYANIGATQTQLGRFITNTDLVDKVYWYFKMKLALLIIILLFSVVFMGISF